MVLVPPPLVTPVSLSVAVISKVAVMVCESVIINSRGFNVGSTSPMSPVHPTKSQPSLGTAVSNTFVTNAISSTITFSSVTSPSPSMIIVRIGTSIISKVAVTVFESVIINSIGFNVGSISPMSPVQPAKTQPTSATAVNFTIVPLKYSVVFPEFLTSSITSPCPFVFTVSTYLFRSKFAVIVCMDRTVILLVSSVLPSDHPVKEYPVFGVAVTVIMVPVRYFPPWVLTVPPSPAETVRLNKG